MKTIKNVKIKFKEEPKVLEKELPVKERREKFVTAVSIDEEAKRKLKRVFAVINRCRHLAIRYIKERPDVKLTHFKNEVIKVLTKDQLPHIVISTVSQELYHIHRSKGEDKDPTTKSISFYEDKMVNNRFTINYRRDKIMLEDLDILLDLEERIPRFDEERQYYLNICVDDLMRMDYVYINVFYYPAKRD